MKIAGKDIKSKPVLIGGGVTVAIVYFTYMKRKKAQAASAAAATPDPNAIDPATGLPYSQEGGYGQDAGIGYQYSVPNPYVGQAGSLTTNSGAGYTSNTAWVADAEQYAVNTFGASITLFASAVGKYLAQSPSGLNGDEYQLMSEVIGLIGQPPNGSFRLIQAAPVSNPSGGGGTTPSPGQHMKQPDVYTLAHGISLQTFARWNASLYHMSTDQFLAQLVSLNPSIPPTDTSHPTELIRTSPPTLVNN